MVIQARTEVTVKGKLVKTTAAKVGMVKSHSSRTQEHDIHRSHIAVHPRDKIVPVRIMNTSHEPIELIAGRKIAEFHQLLSSKLYLGEFPIATNNVACGTTTSATSFARRSVLT